jgi:NAD dependent epimerase/dehydratase family enzyme
VTNRQLTTALGKALGRPTFFKVPAFMAKIIFGQMADEMVLSSTRAIPRVLLAAGYTFQDTSLNAVLQKCVKPF